MHPVAPQGLLYHGCYGEQHNRSQSMHEALSTSQMVYIPQQPVNTPSETSVWLNSIAISVDILYLH